MRTKAAQAKYSPAPLDTVIPTGEGVDPTDTGIVRLLMDSALLTATVQSDAPSSRKRLANLQKREAKVIWLLKSPLSYQSVILFQQQYFGSIRT